MKSPGYPVALMLGGNLGDTLGYFENAVALLQEQVGEILAVSAVYISEPWGLKNQPVFKNQAILLTTRLSAQNILTMVKNIETRLGRVRRQLNGPREIDIDILLYGDQIINDHDLIIPHPRLHLRKFNLVPLAEIAPGWIHPGLQKTIRELADACDDVLEIQKSAEHGTP